MISCFNFISEWWQQNHFQNGDDKTILKKLEKQFISVIKLKTNLCIYYIYWASEKFWKER